MKHLKEMSKGLMPKVGDCGCSKLEDKSAKEKPDKKNQEPVN
jgi:hypothetical protein